MSSVFVALLWCVLALLALAVVAVGFAARPRATPLIYVATAIVSVVACTTAFIGLDAGHSDILRLPLGRHLGWAPTSAWTRCRRCFF